MKTRQELQKEVNWLKSELNEAKNAGKSASILHEYYLNKSKQLQSELEVANNHVQHFQNQILEMVNSENHQTHEYRDENICMRYDIRESKRTESELKDELNQLKSLNLFQLIRWWYNAKN